MSRHADGTIEMIRDGSSVPESRRDVILDDIARIMSSNWHSTQRHWTRADSPFHGDHGLLLAHVDGQAVGYSIYKRVTHDGTLALYRAGAAVVASHQRGGHYRRMSEAMLAAEWNAHPEAARLYLAWRTRNPLIWEANARCCVAVAPSIADGQTDTALEAAGLRLARSLYPDCPIAPPAMVMRDVYSHLAYLHEPYDQVTSPVASWYAAAVPDPADAVFSIGIVRRPGTDPDSPR